MPCLLIVIAIYFPRMVLALIWLFTSWFSQAFDTMLWPLIGFLCMPYTTLAYMTAMLNNHHAVTGGWVLVIGVAVAVDLGGQGHSAKRRRWLKD